MPPKDISLPFLTRDMLRFEQGTKFQLSVVFRSFVSQVITVRGATRQGLFTHAVAIAANNNETESLVALPDIPIWVSIVVAPNQTDVNSTYVQVGLKINGTLSLLMCSGYLYDSKGLSWPMSNIEPPLPSSFGRPISTIGSAPAAGSNVTFGLPIGIVARIKSLHFTLTTSAAVATRRVHLSIEHFEGHTYEIWPSTDQTASLTRKYQFPSGISIDSATHDDDILCPLPSDLVLSGDSIIRTNTVNLQAGDQFTGIGIFYEQWFGISN